MFGNISGYGRPDGGWNNRPGRPGNWGRPGYNGGFAGPFLLGTLAGAALTPNYPIYSPYPYYPPYYYPPYYY